MPQAVCGSSICNAFTLMKKAGKLLRNVYCVNTVFSAGSKRKNDAPGLAGSAAEYICKKPITAVQTK